MDKDIRENLVFGKNPVTELLRTGRALEKLYIAKGEEGRAARQAEEARSRGIVVSVVSREKLNHLCGTDKHQGVAAVIPGADYHTVDEIFAFAESRGEQPFILIADGIEDPHNLGAIIRTADACGAHGVIIPKHRAVGLTASVAKSSAGASQHIMVAKVTNIPAAIDELRERGVWVYAADAGGDKSLFETDFTGAVALVVGGENSGVGRLVAQKCDFIIRIPMYGRINSLNASVAAALMMYEVRRKRI